MNHDLMNEPLAIWNVIGHGPICRHCGRPRSRHGKTFGRCPSPVGKTWQTFEAKAPEANDEHRPRTK